MHRRILEWISCLAWVATWALASIWIVGCGGSELGTEPAETEGAPVAAGQVDELVLAIVSPYPATALDELKLFTRWLNERLAPEGLRISVKVAATVPEVAAWFSSGEADFFVDSPHPVLLASSLSGCRPILRRWKFGSPTYHSVFFVRADSGIQSWSDLSGRIVAFEDRYSSSSFFLPMGFLLEAGVEGTFVHDVGDPVPTDRPAWVFSGGDSTTVHWVLAGKVAAGAMNELNFNRFAGQDKDQLRILDATDEIPRGLFAARADLEPEIECKVVDLLLSAGDDEPGREALKAFSSTDRFDSIPQSFVDQMESLQESAVQIDALVRDFESPLLRP